MCFENMSQTPETLDPVVGGYAPAFCSQVRPLGRGLSAWFGNTRRLLTNPGYAISHLLLRNIYA